MKKLYSNGASDDNFEKLIMDIKEKNNYLGYIHSENPNDPEKLYIKIQATPPSKNKIGQKEGIPLKEFIEFLQDLYEEEMKVRKLTE